MRKEIMTTLQAIEKIEKTWRRELTQNESVQHSYGRVPEDGREVMFWSIPRTTGYWLHAYVSARKPQSILELGASAGYSTLWLAAAAEVYGGKVKTTEIFPAKVEMLKKNLAAAGMHAVQLLEEDIGDVLAKWSGRLDFVFMDADKENYQAYYEQIIPLLSSGGVIIADNAGNYSHLMRDFLNTVKHDARVISYFIDLDNGLLVIEKK